MTSARAHRSPRTTATLVAAGAGALALVAAGAPAGAAPATVPLRSGAASAQAAPISGGAAQRDGRVTDALNELVRAGATAAVAVVDDGERTTGSAVGRARLDPPRPARTDDTTRVGSITKTFVATAVLQQVAAGRIGLDEPIERRLPGLVPNGRAITVRMLLQHTSGLFNYTDDETAVLTVLAHPTRHVDPQWLLDVAFSHPAVFPPGSGWSYSNTNYVVLGLLLEKVTGQPAQTVLDRRIIRPLGLRHTYLAVDGSWRGPHLHGYAPPGAFGNTDYLDVSGWNPSWAWTAGALVSNPDDLATFYRALMSGRLLPAAQLRAMTTTVTTDLPQLRYGLGLYRLQTPCGAVWGHDGGIPGYVTQAFVDRRGSRTAVLAVPTEPDAAIGAAFEPALLAVACRMVDRSPSGAAPSMAGSDRAAA